ncbi:MAG: Rha family transcriptional regulator, partial [Candidatus Afipia apatlaquensis]|nr:Rha family transcriptional regulator [Candidatus Afipia apatlaquensis]
HLNVRSDVRRILKTDGLLASGEPVTADGPRLFLHDGAFHCDSRDIALHFGKQHKNVLRDIDNAMESLGDFGRLNFEPSSYLNEQGKSQRCFHLTRDGFTIIAMGFTGSDAMEWKVKYMTAFNAMEAEIRNITSVPQVAPEVVARLERLEGDVSALTDLCLSQPQPEPGFIIIKAHKRRVRGSH